MTRSLKEWYDLTGWDDSPWAKLMMECEPGDAGHADLTLPVPDSAVWSLRGMPAFLPPKPHLGICREKGDLAKVVGDLAPNLIWVRNTMGSGGAGAQMAQEFLPGRNFSCELVYNDGVLLQNFIKERISYSVKGKTEGLDNRGTSAVSVCRRNQEVLQRSVDAISLLVEETGDKANGFYGLDFKEDTKGTPKLTEINAGRLLTASYPYFYQTGFNLPLVGVRAFFGETSPELPEYPEGWGLVWQIGQKPRVVPPDMTEGWK